MHRFRHNHSWPMWQALVILMLGCLQTPAVLLSEDQSAPWPQFLGPNRNGISSETNLLKTWPAGGPQEVWRKPGGVGMSGFAISNAQAITMYQDDSSQYVVALNVSTGAEIWRSAVSDAFTNQMGDGPRSTPTIANNQVFVVTGEGHVVALDSKTGKPIWSYQKRGRAAAYGMACSPLVVGNHVIATIGDSGGTVVALDRRSGKLQWAVGKDPAGYSSPALLKIDGREQVVAFTGAAAHGIDPETGKPLWRYQFVTDYECNIATPIAYQNQVFLSAGENHGCALLGLVEKEGGFTVHESWASLGPRSVLRNEWQTSVLVNGHLFGMDNVGSAGPVTHLACVDIETGQRRWQESRFGKGNLIAADGKLFISTIEGELVVARASPDQYEELGRKSVLGFTRQAPALANGLLYLRDDEEFVCLDVSP